MKLIDKDTLIAEIEKLINRYKACQTHSFYEEGLKEGRLIGYEDALYKINTSEVKEVDFELGLNAQDSSIGFQNIDDILKEEGIDPDSKEAKVIKEAYFVAIDKAFENFKKGE